MRKKNVGRWTIGLVAWVILLSNGLLADNEATVVVPGLTIRQVAAQPQIVTPVSCVTDEDGDLWVIESNTHFRPDNYPGPKYDRILRYRKPLANDQLSEPEVVCNWTTHTMQISTGPNGTLYVATRREVFRFPRNAKDVSPTSVESILKLVTEGDYPHNGLSGMAFDRQNNLYVGMGENLGVPYQLMNNEGQTIEGGGEGGNLFRCDADGKNLERVATGFWNPFGLCFDDAGRMWAVDNDPDASPPCRLLHVVPGADYGFQFRFGRAGTSPLIAWNGQLPGTLGYAAGTGESPCAVVMHRGYLWVTSWGDNRIERYRMEANGTLLTAKPEVVVQGTTQFRPVGLAVASNGSLFVTDWVDRSYTLHRTGKIWRMDFDSQAESTSCPSRTSEEQLAFQLSHRDPMWAALSSASKASIEEWSSSQSEAAMRSADPVLRSAAIWGSLSSEAPQRASDKKQDDTLRESLLQRAYWVAFRGKTKVDQATTIGILQRALQDSSPRIRMMAVRWAAEIDSKDLVESIERLLINERLDLQELQVALASLEYLEGKDGNRQGGGKGRLLQMALDKGREESLRSLAVSLMEPSQITDWTPFQSLAAMPNRLGRQASRLLALGPQKTNAAVLLEIAKNESLSGEHRADALMGLASSGNEYRQVFEELSRSQESAVAIEAKRVLRRIDEPKRGEAVESSSGVDVDSWLSKVAEGGSKDAGWRIFFRTGTGQCSACHAFEHRGAKLGPDLSTIAGAQNRRRALESLLMPSKEIGPLFVPWKILTTDDQILIGLKLHQPGANGKTRYLSNRGETFDVALEDIVSQSMVEQSIMPEGLCQTMEIDELRDLLALLVDR